MIDSGRSDGGNQDFGPVGPRGLEDVDACGVAVKYLESHFSQEIDAVGIIVEDGRLDPVRLKKRPTVLRKAQSRRGSPDDADRSRRPLSPPSQAYRNGEE